MGTFFRISFFLRASALAMLVLALPAAQAQAADGPGRAARFEATEGSVQFQSSTDGQMHLADPRWPLTSGDRITTAAGSRSELHAGSATVRLGENSDLAFTALDDRMTQLRLTAGTLGLVVRDLMPGERFEVDTPNLALVLDRPGRWRLDVDAARNTTRVTAEQGSGTLYGDNGQPLAFAAPQSRAFAFRTLAESAPLPSNVGDGFDGWSYDRDRIAAQSPSLRYASADIPGVVQLDGYGDWGNDPQYGAIWYPRSVGADWAPYRNGHWEFIAPWGWTWIDDAPWGFAPFHYGRWAQTGNRWGWIPGPRQARPAYTAVQPFNGARPRVPEGFGRGPGLPPQNFIPRIGSPIEPLHDQVRRDEWARNQRAQQDQHQADMQRQQQMRDAQQRFQPSYQQNQLQEQRGQIERQQQQLMFQQQRQQQDQMRQQQAQQQQMQAQQQQQRQQQMQAEQQQRQQQAEQQRQQLQNLQQQQQQQQQQQIQQIRQREGGQPRFVRPEPAPAQSPRHFQGQQNR